MPSQWFEIRYRYFYTWRGVRKSGEARVLLTAETKKDAVKSFPNDAKDLEIIEVNKYNAQA